jgi:dTDP-4-amino-4,6-dideoxygalactose transaminase
MAKVVYAVPLVIPVMLPKLPDWDAIAVYARQIDATRRYSNFGPLVDSLEQGLEDHFKSGAGTVVTVVNATAGLTIALQEAALDGGRYCVLPSWTFAATAQAVLMSGLIPYFVDVDRSSGQISPAIARTALTGRDVAAVVAVSPFGQPIDVDSWVEFRDDTGIAVVIDSAAAFDAASVSALPCVVSMHATKPLSCGEGGFVLSSDTTLISNLRRRANFGLDRDRIAQGVGLNGKMSEYHAAVALAALDSWRTTRAELFAVGNCYRACLADCLGASPASGWAESWISSTLVVRIDGPVDRDAVERRFEDKGVETRRWWGNGCHEQPAFAGFPHDSLPVAESIACQTLGLPFYRGLTSSDVEHIMGSLHDALRS